MIRAGSDALVLSLRILGSHRGAFSQGSTTILDEYRRQEIEMFVQLYMQPPTHC